MSILLVLQKIHLFLTSLFKGLPLIAQKICIGVAYGTILSFIMHFIGRLFFTIIFIAGLSLYLLKKLSCISIHWDVVYHIIGISSFQELFCSIRTLCIVHNIECFTAIITLCMLSFITRLYR